MISLDGAVLAQGALGKMRPATLRGLGSTPLPTDDAIGVSGVPRAQHDAAD